jgi:hypothetical protein
LEWIKRQGIEEVTQEDGTVKLMMGESMKDKLKRIKAGDTSVKEEIKAEGIAENLHQPENYDLVAWLLVSDEK